MKRDSFYITTPIYYVNDIPHIGHSYTTIIADVLSRWSKLSGKKVFFLTGTDEHGKKIQDIAEKKGINPKQFVEGIVNGFKKAWAFLGIDYDNFIRTTDEKHIKFVKKALNELYEKKLIYKGEYEGCYCVGCEQYKTKNELEDGKCPIHKTEVEFRSEEAYLFKLSGFQKQLEELIRKDKYKIRPVERKNEILGFLENKLQDVCISRKKEEVYLGIELPFDNKYTCYVWVDAFLNYLTGLKDKKFWPPDIQLMAKDIVRVHATIWPALLLALGEKLPKQIFAHGYFTYNGEKMSKSLGNVIDPLTLSEKYSSDVLRYFMMKHIPPGSDGDFSEEILKERHNNELANKLGNLISRVAGLCKGRIEKGRIDGKLSKKLNLGEIKRHFEDIALDKALIEIFSFIDSCNEYVQEKQPWALESKKKKDVLYSLVDSIRIISILISSFMPETSEKIDKQFGFKKGTLKECRFGLAKSEKIEKSDVLFKKI